ncbi:hypothetical protein FOMG_19880 [Fusarium oxysporum f. sp. melonis 26406]|uniref:Uncharacterized protein n=1 Tax=Fusarium oxysporum f. sp. melonis 26406 TaxID=1089452 RepID=W9YUT8_FUSOX|nr:hypothetical protein FOMG_19880 [Fusarium oxysporum f. sp. melonis 26406]
MHNNNNNRHTTRHSSLLGLNMMQALLQALRFVSIRKVWKMRIITHLSQGLSEPANPRMAQVAGR